MSLQIALNSCLQVGELHKIGLCNKDIFPQDTVQLIKDLLKHCKVDDLARMYRLFRHITDGLPMIATVFKDHLTGAGMTLVEQANKTIKREDVIDVLFVRKAIELHNDALHYVVYCFGKSPLLYNALKEAFEFFLNKRINGSTSAEILANCCDIFLKKAMRESIQQYDAVQSMKILSYVNDKDLFGEFYWEKMARRLLLDQSFHEQREKEVILKMKAHLGMDLIDRLDSMLKDFKQARENQAYFVDYLSAARNELSWQLAGIELSVSVLSTPHWPIYRSPDFTVPPELAKCIETFENFYHSKF